jgi:hypothetical protein
MPQQPVWQMTREERREIAREKHGGMRGTLPEPRIERRCLFCRGRLTNGSAVCSDECDAGWWSIVPTISGELWRRG